MTGKQWVMVATIAGGLAAVIAVGWEIDRTRRSEIRNGGAVEEKFKECCDRVDALDARISEDQRRQDEGAISRMQRITALESQAEWWKRRAEAQDIQMNEILTRLGRIEGKLDGHFGASGR